MKKEHVLDMTEGNILRLLINFAVPMLIGNLFQQLYNIVDSIVVGRLIGADALAAIGVTGSISFLFFALCNGIGAGGGIIVSQYFGMNNDKLVKSCITNTAYIMTAFPAVVGAIAFILAKPLLIIMKTPDNILDTSVTYLKILCVGLVFVSVYNFVSSMLRALGDSKTPLYFLIFSCILNTILDIVFVKYLNMNVAGAGIATLISQLVSGGLCIWYAIKTNPYFRPSKEDFAINKDIITSTIKLGIPLSLQFSLIAISTMALQRVVNTFGAVAVAAFTAVSRIEQIIHQPYQTLSSALSTFTGQNYGAKQTDRMKEGYKKSILLMVIFTVAMFITMQLFGKPVTALFVDDVAVIEMGATALKITSWFYLPLGAIYIVRGILTGVGDSFFALYNGVIEVIGRFTIPILLTSISFIGVWGLWWSVGIVWLISGFTAWLRYATTKKKFYNIN